MFFLVQLAGGYGGLFTVEFHEILGGYLIAHASLRESEPRAHDKPLPLGAYQKTTTGANASQQVGVVRELALSRGEKGIARSPGSAPR